MRSIGFALGGELRGFVLPAVGIASGPSIGFGDHIRRRAAAAATDHRDLIAARAVVWSRSSASRRCPSTRRTRDRAEHHDGENDRDHHSLLRAGAFDVRDLTIASEHEIFAGLDKAQANVTEIETSHTPQLDLAVVLAVDPDAVRRLQIADRVALGLGVARESSRGCARSSGG